jgi:hypothetical protein
MPSMKWCAPLVTAASDGNTLVAAAAASCIPTGAKYVLEGGFFDAPGKQLKIEASGRISNAVTTPGTARFDVRLGGTVVFDGLAVPLNIIAKTNVGWWLEIILTCRTIGATATLIGQGTWTSESAIGSALATVTAPGSLLLPYNTAPAVGNTFDSTAALALDMFFTQTVATGSLTLHQYTAIG